MQSLLSVRLGFAGTAYLNRFAEILAPTGLTPGRLLAVAILQSHPACDQNFLARGLSITKASAMALVDKLQAQGLVERRPGADRRSNALHLTVEGEAVFAEAMRLEAELHDELFGWMSELELQRLTVTINEITRRASREPVDVADKTRTA